MQTQPRPRRHVRQMTAPIVEIDARGRSVSICWPGTGVALLVEEGVSARTWPGREGGGFTARPTRHSGRPKKPLPKHTKAPIPLAAFARMPILMT